MNIEYKGIYDFCKEDCHGSSKALIAYAGIDAPPYQSGRFTGTERHMSKRGSRIMRKLGFELMDSINKHQNGLLITRTYLH